MSSTAAAKIIETLLGLTTNLIERVKDRKLATEIREIQSLITALQSENAKLLSENLDLKKSISKLENMQTSHKTKSSDEFIEFKSVAFKRKPSGGFFDTAYCPACNKAMMPTEGFLPFMCGGGCGVSAFKQHELTSIFEEFLSEYS